MALGVKCVSYCAKRTTTGAHALAGTPPRGSYPAKFTTGWGTPEGVTAFTG
ncbi:hypothetical protein ACIBJF_28520 [Streptomyces sp. NPDC050743]|uniref:hypothetical protein n=1 Tax=Streptomyces sp. NPDC050743 TaxID=3365634 RepID=UPI0037AA6550